MFCNYNKDFILKLYIFLERVFKIKILSDPSTDNRITNWYIKWYQAGVLRVPGFLDHTGTKIFVRESGIRLLANFKK